MTPPPNDLYKSAGVNIDAGDKLAQWLAADNQSTHLGLGQPLDGLGNFAGLFKPNFAGFKEPVLVSSTDGVGTKILLALEHDALEGVGIDLVAMCVNDLYTLGALPLFFLDYYASGKLDETQFKTVLTSIKQGLATCQTPLLGGETAELPGLYAHKHFDLAGFVIGVVDQPQILGQHLVENGDRVIALASEGFHSNGFSLIRHWLKETETTPELIENLLAPTKIYAELKDLFEQKDKLGLHALANITGGGISGNLNRVLPHGSVAKLTPDLDTPKWMKDFILQHTGSLLDVETTFNLGVGMTAVVKKASGAEFIQACEQLGLKAYDIGSVSCSDHKDTAKVAYEVS